MVELKSSIVYIYIWYDTTHRGEGRGGRGGASATTSDRILPNMPRLFLCLVFTMVAQAEGLVVTAGLRVNPSPAPATRSPTDRHGGGRGKEGGRRKGGALMVPYMLHVPYHNGRALPP